MKFKPPVNPWEPPELSDPELLALKNLAAGNANEHQQRLSLAIIIKKFACGYDMSFRPGGAEGARATDFAEGRRWVASRIIEAIDRPMAPRGESNVADPRIETRRNPKPDPSTKKPGA